MSISAFSAFGDVTAVPLTEVIVSQGASPAAEPGELGTMPAMVTPGGLELVQYCARWPATGTPIRALAPMWIELDEWPATICEPIARTLAIGIAYPWFEEGWKLKLVAAAVSIPTTLPAVLASGPP